MDESYSKTQPADSEVWKLLKAGEREALRTLFLRYYDDLYLYAFKLSSDSYLAKDCIQDLFYRIWDRRKHLGEVTSVKSYLWISLRRDVFKTIDKQKEEIKTDGVFKYASVLTFTSEDFIIHDERRREQRNALVKALDQLPERHREAILLKYFNGMGYGEIQQIMSINYQTARNYVYHGVKLLKDHFKDRVFVPATRTAV